MSSLFQRMKVIFLVVTLLFLLNSTFLLVVKGGFIGSRASRTIALAVCNGDIGGEIGLIFIFISFL